MSILDTLITDRVPGAAYNAADFNRVAAAMQYISQRLRDTGQTTTVAPKEDWTRMDFPTPAAIQWYLAQMAILKAALPGALILPDIPDVSKSYLTVAEANDIEKILVIAGDMLEKLAAVLVPTGLYPSGAVYYFISR